ncbi:hypothetical protein QUC31_001402 [Theobroma cacao]
MHSYVFQCLNAYRECNLQNDEDLVHEIEDELENNWKILNAKRMKSFPILQSMRPAYAIAPNALRLKYVVCKAKRVASMEMTMDDGFEWKVEEHKK